MCLSKDAFKESERRKRNNDEERASFASMMSLVNVDIAEIMKSRKLKKKANKIISKFEGKQKKRCCKENEERIQKVQ